MTTEPAPAAPRYAVYFAPRPDSPDWQRGSHWLGRCAATEQPLAQPVIDGVAPAEFERLTQAPRRYGWHATLKAPFALAPGVGVADLRTALRTVARSLQAFEMPPLQVARLDDFLALVPVPTHPGHARLHEVAAACVTQLQPLAAPLLASALARRRAAGLTPREDELLQRWGYPYVLEAFRFHFSLTGALGATDAVTVARVHAAAQAFFADPMPGRCDRLALFVEPAPGADFVLLDQMEMGE
jgi:putative phosphonate metabolism protein